MIEHTKHQIIKYDGIPVAAIIPYNDYQQFLDWIADQAGEDILSDEEYEAVVNEKNTIPHEVVSAMVRGRMSLIRAWREYLNLTQEEVAKRMGVTQPVYARMESGKTTTRLSSLKKIAKAFDINHEQLDAT